MRRFVTLCVLFGWALAAGADDPPAAAYRAQIEAARSHLRGDNKRRAFHCYLAALGLRPDGPEALLGLAELTDLYREALIREAWLRAPDDAGVKTAVARLKRPPAHDPKGRATALVAVYLGRARRDGRYDAMPSLDVGATLRRDLLLVQGRDADGRLVPVEPEVLPGDEFARTGGRITALRPSRAASLTVRDLRSGLLRHLQLRLVGSPARLVVRARPTYVAPGGQSHLAAMALDVAGNRLWVPRIDWSASGGGAARRELLAPAVTRVPPAEFFELHRAVVTPQRAGYRGELTVTARLPATTIGQSAPLTIGETPRPPRTLGKLAWSETTLAGALARGGREGRPVLVYIHAAWSSACKQLEAGPLSDAGVVETTGRLVTVALDRDEAGNRALLTRYELTELPAILLLSASGHELARLTGAAATTPRLRELIATAAARQTEVRAREVPLRKAAEDGRAASRDALFAFLASGRRHAEAQALLAASRAALEPASDAAQGLLVREVWCDLSLARWARTRARCQAAIAAHPTSRWRAGFEYYLGMAILYGDDDPDGAISVWSALLKRAPGSNWASSARRMIARARAIR